MTQTSTLTAALLAASLFAAPAFADPPAKPHDADKDEPAKHALFTPSAKATDGSVTVGGKPVAYQAVAGTLVVHAKGWDDAAKPKEDGKDDDDHNPDAEASMFYVAYFAKGAPARAGR